MKFEISHTFDADMKTVIAAMFNDDLPAFLQQNMNTIIEIEPQSKETVGQTIRRRVRYLPQPLIKKIGPKEVPPRWMEWVEESEFDAASNRLSFTNRPSTQKIANLLINRGTMTFRESGGRTTRTVQGELTVKVFLLGKIAEKFIFKQAGAILDDEAAALKKFIASLPHGIASAGSLLVE